MAEAGEYAESADYAAWDQVLAAANPRLQARAARPAGPEVLPQLHAVAAELRDRLRYSEKRTRELKSELHAARSEALQKFQVLEAEVLHLRDAVADEADKLASQEASALDVQDALDQMSTHVSAVEAQLDAALSRAEAAEASRDSALQEAAALRAQLDDARGRSYSLEARAQESAEALMASKALTAEAAQLQVLYQSAREELARLDTENHELKEMVSSSATELARSRILDTLPASAEKHRKSTPLFLSPQMMGKRRGRTARRAAGATPGLLYNSAGVLYPQDVADGIGALAHTFATSASLGGNGAGSAAGGGGGRIASAANLASLAFLGPPSSDYPMDPEKFVFVRVAGGYSPKYIGHEPLPKASGWVPKDVVRLAQAFRTTHRIKLEWKHWEPLLLMVDEVYSHGGRRRVRATTGRAESYDLPNQYTGSVASYPAVMQAGMIMTLKKQLQALKSRRARPDKGPDEDDWMWRDMAEKDYHMATALGEAVSENQSLRDTVSRMEDLYSSAKSPM